MTPPPLISICMPVYNTAAYLPAAIEGVLSQTYSNLELLICDNRSTDASAEIARQYAAGDQRVRVVVNSVNVGFAGNLQKVTTLARGDWVLVHCADDVMHPEALQRYVETIGTLGLDPDYFVLMSSYFVTTAEGRPTGIMVKVPGEFHARVQPLECAPRAPGLQRYSGAEMLRAHLQDLQLFAWLGSILFPRSFLERTEGYQGGKWITPDMEFMYKVLALDPPAVYLEEPLFYYRLHESNQLGTELKEAIIKHSLDLYEYTFQYPDEMLEHFGSSRRHLQQVFIDRDCLRKALYQLAVGSWTLALRYVAFALSTYPGVTVRNGKFYLAIAGLISGPLGRIPARIGLSLRRAYQRRQWEQQP